MALPAQTLKAGTRFTSLAGGSAAFACDQTSAIDTIFLAPTNAGSTGDVLTRGAVANSTSWVAPSAPSPPKQLANQDNSVFFNPTVQANDGDVYTIQGNAGPGKQAIWQPPIPKTISNQDASQVTLPLAAGIAGQVLQLTAANTSDWITPAAGGSSRWDQITAATADSVINNVAFRKEFDYDFSAYAGPLPTGATPIVETVAQVVSQDISYSTITLPADTSSFFADWQRAASATNTGLSIRIGQGPNIDGIFRKVPLVGGAPTLQGECGFSGAWQLLHLGDYYQGPGSGQLITTLVSVGGPLGTQNVPVFLDQPAGGTLTTDAVDLAFKIEINQTTALQTISLPVPTSVPGSNAERALWVSNIGSTSFTMHGKVLLPATGSWFSYSVSAAAWIAQA